MMLKKDEAVLKEIEGLSEEKAIQWMMEHYGIYRKDAILALAVARGETTQSDIRVFDDNGNRLYDHGVRPDGTIGKLDEPLDEPMDLEP